jgi:GTPase Era involved in 16S rRNA processing
MVNVQISYNPYILQTDLQIDGKAIEDNVSPLVYVKNKRLQEWIEPKGSWPGIFKALRKKTGEKQITIDFVGTFGDFEDLAYAKDKFGSCFERIVLTHKNRDTAKTADPYQKMLKLKELYQQLQEGPVEEFKTTDIQDNFEAAVNSEFRIVIVAPMSSGKSTLINAILGRDLLPAVNQATTAVITEIKDNDQMKDFLVNADDKYGNSVAKNERATKELISKLNYRKDPNDPEGKKALIPLVQIEGPIPNLPSDVLNTVFVDTPGGNNSQNNEHEAMMDEAINDENKSLILYVFNGAQLATNDSNIILQKIANAMQNSANGKQSRDRFLFVANRMDDFDVSKEPYEEVIEKTILKQLASNGITEPNLFLASAQTAKLIRMTENDEKLSETEEEDLEKLIKRFNRQTRMLSKYASLGSSMKEKLIKSAEKYMAAGETEKNKRRAAEINSGVPAIEMAIKEYLEKYAIAIKIKNIHDTFMEKVQERDMINNCEREWAQSKEEFDAIKRELQKKREKCDHSEKLQEFRDKVDVIKMDKKPIKDKQAEVNRKIDEMVQSAKDKIKLEEADYILTAFKHELEGIGKEAQVALDNALNNGAIRSCQSIIEEYDKYIQELNSDGAFNIGNFDMKKTKEFEDLVSKKAEDMLHSKKYVAEEAVKTGTKTVKKRGFFAAVARIFGGGYETIDIYEDQKFVNLKQLIRDRVTEVQHSFDKEMNEAISDTEKKVERLKEDTMNKLKGLDQRIADLLEEIDKTLVSQKELQKRVTENAEKAEWVKNFIRQVDDLLTV